VKFLIDLSPNRLSEKINSPLVMGQLLTPLTGYADAGGIYAIDNGAFSGFPADRFRRLLERQESRKADCLFVTCPDIVGAGQRSIELFKRRSRWIPEGWKVALVAQDGMEDLEIPWDEMDAIFIGGGDPWKDSKASQDIVKTAVTLGVWVHVGRINTPRRFELFDELGADSCDGSGIAMYDHMLQKIERRNEPVKTLFDDLIMANAMGVAGL
jgi:hypothetical protein